MGIKEKDIYSVIKRNNPYFEDFISRSVYHSNAIEGNTLSYAETYSIVFNDNSFTINSKPRDIYEAINLKYALDFILKNLYEDITPNYIEKIGIIINKNIDEIDGFRRTGVGIRGAEHIPPQAVYVPQLVSEALYKYRNSQLCLFDRIAEFHLDFERIHPFGDGNGRTGRCLIIKELLKEDIAPIVIPVERRTDYFKMLADQNIEALSCFFYELSNNEKERMREFGIKLDNLKKANKLSK